MLAPLVVVGLVAGFMKPGWVVVPAAAVLPAVLWIAGTFDDGEGLATGLLLSVVFAAIAALGLITGRGLRSAYAGLSRPVSTS